jgi:hypothetical protein
MKDFILAGVALHSTFTRSPDDWNHPLRFGVGQSPTLTNRRTLGRGTVK